MSAKSDEAVESLRSAAAARLAANLQANSLRWQLHCARGLLAQIAQIIAARAPGGDVPESDLSLIAESIGWLKGTAVLQDCLQKSGIITLIPGGWRVVDWPVIAPPWVHRRLIKALRKFDDGTLPRLSHATKPLREAWQAHYDIQSSTTRKVSLPGLDRILSTRESPEGLAQHMLNQIQRMRSNFKPPSPVQMRGWVREFELMIRIDRRVPRQICDVIDWLYGPNLDREFSFVVLSPSALRQKYDRIELTRHRISRGALAGKLPGAQEMWDEGVENSDE